MSDLIGRQAAIDAMEESKKIYVDRRVIIGKMQDIVSSLPSAQPKTQLSTEDATFDTTFDCISRQAAIDALNEYFARIGKLKRRGLTKGEKAISLDTVGTIKTLPSAQPEKRTEERTETQSCDLIDRQAAIDSIQYAGKIGKQTCISILKRLPAAQPEVLACGSGELNAQPERTGRWEQVEINYFADMDEEIQESMAIASMFCPRCKRYHNEVYLYGDATYGVNFCPNCGADMRGEKDGN